MGVFHRLATDVSFGAPSEDGAPGGGDRFEFSMGIQPRSEASGAWATVLQGFFLSDPGFDEAWFSGCSTSWQLPWEASAQRAAPQPPRGRVIYSRRVGM
jgi:hypothetical protein